MRTQWRGRGLARDNESCVEQETGSSESDLGTNGHHGKTADQHRNDRFQSKSLVYLWSLQIPAHCDKRVYDESCFFSVGDISLLSVRWLAPRALYTDYSTEINSAINLEATEKA